MMSGEMSRFDLTLMFPAFMGHMPSMLFFLSQGFRGSFMAE